MDLVALRSRLDDIDKRLVAALAERLAVVTSVAGDKLKTGSPLRHVVREEDILTRVAELAREAKLDPFFVVQIFQLVLDHSVRVQQELLTDAGAPERRQATALRVGFQGVEGAYSHLAAQRHFSARDVPVSFVGLETFRAVLEAVQRGDLDRAVLPIENTTAGSINDVYDLLAEMNLFLVGEEVQRVDHCLIGLAADVELSEICRVYSHPMALAQCTEFLFQLRASNGERVHVESFTDTAMAVRKISKDGDRTQAAIASIEAARLYGLPVLRQGVANQRENYTRMVVVARQPERYDLRIPCKTSVVFAVRHEEGALLNCMQRFARHHLSLTKLESRPRPHSPWEYLFYVDFEGNVEDPEVAAVLADLPSMTSFLKVLGSYPARNTSGAKPAKPRSLAVEGGSEEEPAAATETDSVEASQEPAAVGASLDPAELRGAQPRGAQLLSSRGRRSTDSLIRVGEATLGGADVALVLAVPEQLPEARLRSLARAAKASGVQLAVWAASRVASNGVRETSPGMTRSPSSAPPPPDAVGQVAGREILSNEGLEFIERVQGADRGAEAARALWISGSRMDERAVLESVGAVDRTVFLERGAMASLEEWLESAEIIMEQGNQQVVLVEAGVKSFSTASKRSLDLAGVAQLLEDSHLPVLVDPTLCGDSPSSISRLARAAVAAGAHGIVLSVESFPEGPRALLELAHTLTSH